MGYRITPEAIEDFLTVRGQKNRLMPESLVSCRSGLERLYRTLPEDKKIVPGTLLALRESLLDEGLALSTVNVLVSVCNSFFDHIGHRELQAERRRESEKKPLPELTRVEYLRLLQTAKKLGWERTYMVAKTIGSVGLFVCDLPLVTVEAVRRGEVLTGTNRKRDTVRFPSFLCEELLGHAERNGIVSGPIFIARRGLPLNRSIVTRELRLLGAEAGLSEGKANARKLRSLWQRTREDIQAEIASLVEKEANHRLELELLAAGWDV